MAPIVRRQKRLAIPRQRVYYPRENDRSCVTRLTCLQRGYRFVIERFFFQYANDKFREDSSAAQATKEEEDLNYFSTIRQELC